MTQVQASDSTGSLPAQGESPETDIFMEQVRGYGLPLLCLSRREFNKQYPSAPRSQYDAQVMKLIEPRPADAIVLAGYMLVASAELCRRYPLVNLHPALPGGPAGTWQEVIWKLIDRRVAESGVMIHLATPDLDEGPVIAYCRYSLRGGEMDALWAEIGKQNAADLKARRGEELPLFKAIRQRGFVREIPLLVAALGALARAETVVREGRVLSATGRRLAGQDLTEQVERELAKDG